ncbi:dihydroorotase [Aestuariibius sp. 2305UL40-4]|uniref:dihydroorotase n=1 Tax=Aestuariibius violaceus TaxID=3234132 RepID=UPI00345EB488
MTTELTIRRPDDWHLHLRDHALLAAVTPETACHFGRALVMPNLDPPVTTAEHARSYAHRIIQAVPADCDFVPQMTLYLTEDTDPDDVAKAHDEGSALAVKLYPAGATTNSGSGVRDIEKVRPVLARMAEIGMPLCIHGEVTDDDVDIFDREAVFIDKVLKPLRKAEPDLRIVLEHVTTETAVDYIRDAKKGIAATITVHHLIINRNAILAGGIKPDFYCLPVAKREKHRVALVQAAISGDRRFFLGTDSAPHTRDAKLQACGCAGIFTAPNALSCLAEIFETADALPKLEAFTSINGARFYGLDPAEETIRLVKGDPVEYPIEVLSDDGPVLVFDPGFPLHWRVET